MTQPCASCCRLLFAVPPRDRRGRVRWSDFSHRGRELAALGEQAAREKLPEIERLLGRRTTVEEAV